MSRVLTVVLLSVFLFGCASQQVYEGAKRRPEQVAIIKPGSPSLFSFDPGISIREVDGTKLDRLSSGEFEVAPGTHTVTVILFKAGDALGRMPSSSPPKTITFEAAGGETYVVFYRWRNRRESDWILTVKEESSGRTVAEK